MNDRASGSYAFLIEMMAVILFFALSVGVVLSLFVAADKRSGQAKVLSGAVTAAASAAELVRVSDDPQQAFCLEYGGVECDGGYEAWLDPSFMPFGLEEYRLRLACSETDGLNEMKVSILNYDGDEIYSLECVSYAGGAQ